MPHSPRGHCVVTSCTLYGTTTSTDANLCFEVYLKCNLYNEFILLPHNYLRGTEPYAPYDEV